MAFATWLQRQPLSKRTADAYRAQVGAYLSWLAGSEHAADALAVEAVRDWAVRDYKRAMKKRRLKPTTVNQALAAIDALYRSLNMGRPDVRREALAQVAPRALAQDAQRRFLRSVERCPSSRDRAIATLFLYTGLRLSELAALDVGDVSVSPRRGRLRVALGKGDAYREVPLNSACRSALDEWSAAREKQVEALAEKDADLAATEALWLARGGGRLGTRAIDLVVRRLAADAGLEMSAHVLRHTCVTNLIRSGADVVLVAELAGHRRLDTTRRYSLPSEADRDAAVEAVLVET
jgi:site-specific recombinase XerD